MFPGPCLGTLCTVQHYTMVEENGWRWIPVSHAKTESSPCSKGSRPGCHSLQHNTIPAFNHLKSYLHLGIYTYKYCFCVIFPEKISSVPYMPVTKLDGHYWPKQRPVSSHWLLPAYPMETPGKKTKYRKYFYIIKTLLMNINRFVKYSV